MGPLEFGDLPEEALVLVDSPPIIYILEDHPQFGPRFAVTTINAAALVTHDRDFSRLRSLRIIS